MVYMYVCQGEGEKNRAKKKRKYNLCIERHKGKWKRSKRRKHLTLVRSGESRILCVWSAKMCYHTKVSGDVTMI